jgi:hypothetical protein
VATDKIRGLVADRWEAASGPPWSVAETLEVAVAVDRELEHRGLNPARRFREMRLDDDRFGMRGWILGCRFPWLRGRAESGTGVANPETKTGNTSNRRLTADELVLANSLLDLIRSRIDELAGEDPRLTFAYKRKIAKELQYDERGKPVHRIRLKARKRRAQKGMCANDRLPPHPLPRKGAVLDRYRAEDGYTDANTRLLCPECDARLQEEKGYADLSDSEMSD